MDTIYLDGPMPSTYEFVEIAAANTPVVTKDGHAYGALGTYSQEVKGCDKALLMTSAIIYTIITLGVILLFNLEVYYNLIGHRTVKVYQQEEEDNSKIAETDRVAKRVLSQTTGRGADAPSLNGVALAAEAVAEPPPAAPLAAISQPQIETKYGLPLDMVKALGGEEVVKTLSTTYSESQGSAIMRLTLDGGGVALVFKYLVDRSETFEFLTFNGSRWISGGGQLSLMVPKDKEITKEQEPYILDRIERLVRKKLVGKLVRSSKKTYLEGSALQEYKKVQPTHVEQKCVKTYPDGTVRSDIAIA